MLLTACLDCCLFFPGLSCLRLFSPSFVNGPVLCVFVHACICMCKVACVCPCVCGGQVQHQLHFSVIIHMDFWVNFSYWFRMYWSSWCCLANCRNLCVSTPCQSTGHCDWWTKFRLSHLQDKWCNYLAVTVAWKSGFSTRFGHYLLLIPPSLMPGSLLPSFSSVDQCLKEGTLSK